MSNSDSGYREPGATENIYHDLDLVREARHQAYDPPVGQRLSENSYVLPSGMDEDTRPPSAHSDAHNTTPDIYLNPRESIHAMKAAANQYDPKDRQYVM